VPLDLTPLDADVTEALTPLAEGTETLAALAEDVQADYVLLPGAATFPGATTYPGEYHRGLRLDALSED
jgi:hypothetical protein